MPRRTGRIEPSDVIEVSLEPEVEEYPVTIMLSREGYLKKMTDRVLRKAAELKYKDGDEPFIEFPSANTHELLVFTNKTGHHHALTRGLPQEDDGPRSAQGRGAQIQRRR